MHCYIYIYIFFKKNQMLILITLQPHSYCSEYFKYLYKKGGWLPFVGLISLTWLTSWRKRWKYKFFSTTCSDVFFLCVSHLPSLSALLYPDMTMRDSSHGAVWLYHLYHGKSENQNKNAERCWTEWEFNLTAERGWCCKETAACAFKWIHGIPSLC